MQEQALLSILYDLVRVNLQRIQGYQNAIQETDEDYLRKLFIKFQSTSHSIHCDLYKEIHVLGDVGEPLPNPALHLSYTQNILKKAKTRSDRNTILNNCEYAEAMAEEVYKKVMAYSIFRCPPALQFSIRQQYNLLSADYISVRAQRDMSQKKSKFS